tara:strand:- start:351 stop:686 length:336 start_codon:yes stop_codon:yes gene_type:complete
MIKFSLKLDDIEKEFIQNHKNGKKYLNLVAWERPDEYGNTHIIKQDLNKEQREQDKVDRIMRPIVGNLDASRLIEDVKRTMAGDAQPPSEPVAARGSAPQSQNQDDFDPPF